MSATTNSTCPVCRTAEIVCGKWTLLLISDLADGCSRFCELERSLEGISPRTLSLRLRALEEEGIVERHTFPEVPPRVEYALTDKGEALVPLVDDMRTLRHPLAAGGQTPSRRRRLDQTSRAGVCKASCRRRSVARPGGSLSRARFPLQRSPAPPRHRGRDPVQRDGRRRRAGSLRRRRRQRRGGLALLQLRADDRPLRARPLPRSCARCPASSPPARPRSRPASPLPTWRPAASPSRPTRASAPS